MRRTLDSYNTKRERGAYSAGYTHGATDGYLERHDDGVEETLLEILADPGALLRLVQEHLVDPTIRYLQRTGRLPNGGVVTRWRRMYHGYDVWVEPEHDVAEEVERFLKGQSP